MEKSMCPCTLCSITPGSNIKAAVAIGSPITDVNRQKIVFIEDKSDIVPSLSVKSMLLSMIYRKLFT